MSTMTPEAWPPTSDRRRRTRPEAIKHAGRNAAQRLVQRGGAGVARLDSKRQAHAVLLLAVHLLIPRLFDPDSAGDLDARLELRITDPAGGDPDISTVVIKDRRCRVLAGPDPSGARVALTVGADDLVRMVSGEIGWPQLVSAKRLVLWGDPYLALRFPLLFGLAKGPGESALLALIRPGK
jgi:hypothetical protein